MPLGDPKPDSPYSYIRTEIRVLKSLRAALNDAAKINALVIIPASDPKRLHKLVERNEVVNAIADDYGCAIALLKPYQNSRDNNVHVSVEAFNNGIDITQQADAKLLEMMESLDKATRAEDFDQPAIAKQLADLNSIKQDSRKLILMGVKMSSFGILKLVGGDDDSKPVAFTITEQERLKLLSDANELAKREDPGTSYIDICADFLVDTLTKSLPTLP